MRKKALAVALAALALAILASPALAGRGHDGRSGSTIIARH
jgi:hypothetical protein